MYYNLSIERPRSSKIPYLSVFIPLLIILTIFTFSGYYNQSDYVFYGRIYSPILSRIQSKNNFTYQNHSTLHLLQVSSPFIKLDPRSILEKFSNSSVGRSFSILFPDTTKQDSTKKSSKDTVKNFSISDSIKKSDSLKTLKILLTADSSHIISSDSSKKETSKTGKSDTVLTTDTSLHRNFFGNEFRINKKDTSKSPDNPFLSIFDSIASIDTARLIDSIATKGAKKLLLYDSTARIQNFKARPEDLPTASVFKNSMYPLFGTRKEVVTYEIKIDSTADIVTISEKVDGRNVKMPIWMKLDDYIFLTREYYTKMSWEDIAHKYELKLTKEKIEIGSLLTNITNIDIPIPENPLMSIFGDRSRINLRISGGVNIQGSFRSNTTEGIVASRLGNTTTAPDFHQTVTIRVDGTVGDKLTLGADWDTQRMFDFEQLLKISYKGYEDEIIQSITAGNVGISSTSSFIGGAGGLFGITAQMAIGPLKLTAVASQKKSEKKEKTITSGSEKSPFELRAYQYSTSHFFVDTIYRQKFYPFYFNPTPQSDASTQIQLIEVWVTRPGSIVKPGEEREVVADIDLPPLPPNGTYDQSYKDMNMDPGRIEVGRFIQLKKDQYILRDNGYTGYITLTTSIQPNQAIAVAYRTPTKTYGYFSNAMDTSITARVVLKLVKPSNLIPQFKHAWNLQLKNIYPVGGRGITKDGLTNLKIWYKSPAAGVDVDNIDGNSLLQILNLDQYDESGAFGSDGKFDYKPGVTFDEQRGEIIFPNLEPFRECFVNYRKDGKPLKDDTIYVYDDVYDNTYIAAQQNTDKNKFVIKGEYSATGGSSTYRLGMSVVPGSVQVFLAGVELKAGVDYIVDEIGGQIIIKKDEALLPGANLSVKYEENDLISFASKSLIGATGEIDVGRNSKLGFTWINLVQQTLSDKVRLGEEPINNHIFGLSGSSAFELPFLTSALNRLPFFSSNESSNISFSGEVAAMLPDPNTKKSTIPMDNNEGVAYIDDFEGARQSIPMGTGYSIWHFPSAPAELPGFGPLADSIVSGYKAKTIWYNIIPSDVIVTDIWPKKSVATSDQQVQYLNVQYDPGTRGQYNYRYPFSYSSSNWGGLMRSLGSNATNLTANNYTSIEIWMKIESSSGANLQNAKMFIDLGRISEKVITDPRVPSFSGGLHTEDGITAGSPTPNGILDPGEDVGIDGLNDEQERALFPNIKEDDPSGDDFSYAGTGSVDFSKFNGVEGNANNASSDAGKLPDTEDLNRDGVLNESNSYFEYEISLDSVIARSKKQIVGGETNGWHQYRIPLNQFIKAIGTPSFDVVESCRFWISGTSVPVRLKIAEFDIVGNQWLAVTKKDSANNATLDSSFEVGVVSIEDNPEYSSPPDVGRAVDRTRPDQNILANEQALDLNIKSLPDGESREAVRYFTMRPLDVFNYKNMKLYIWGDDRFKYYDTSNYDAEFHFRFGVDTANYYEYSMPLRHGWAVENNISIEFIRLTAVKAVQDTTGGRRGRGSISVEGKPGHFYRILGSPTLTNITYLSVSVTNPINKGSTMPIAGHIWVNELRLTGANDTKGYAYRFGGSIKLSSFGSINFGFSKTDGYFHTVDQKFGSRNDTKSWNLSGSFALQNLLPKELLGTNLNVSFSHSESINDPIYIPGTDISVLDASTELSKINPRAGDSLKTLYQSISVSETFAMPTIAIKIPVDKWYIQNTINSMGFSFNYNNSRSRDPQIERRETWGWSFGFSYSGLTLSNLLSLQPFTKIFDGLYLLDQYKNFKLSFLPDVSLGLNANRSRTEEKYRIEAAMRNPAHNFSSSRNLGALFKLTEGGLFNLNLNYTVSVSGSYNHLETDALGNPRSMKEILSDIFFKKRIMDFGLDAGLDQSIAITYKTALPKFAENIENYVSLSMGDYKINYRWQNNIAQGDLGKSAGWSNSLSPTFSIKLKAIGDKLFGVSSSGSTEDLGGRRGRIEDDRPTTPNDSSKSQGKKIKIMDILKNFIKVPFFEFDNISVSFSQSNNASNSGIPGYNGFNNVWKRIPFFQSSIADNGPSLIYQLGLISDPTGKLVRFGPRPRFPFFGFDYEPGIRVPNPNGSLSDNFAQTNNLTLSTSRTIFTGMNLSLNWKVGWNYNRLRTFSTDTSLLKLGFPDPAHTTDQISTTIDRSFIALPDNFIFKLLGAGGIQKVSDLYAKKSSAEPTGDPTKDAAIRNESLQSAFEEGFEALPLLSKIFGSFAPRANWSFSWNGLEKLPLLSSIATSVSLNHSYTSSHSKRLHIDPITGTVTDGQRISYGFSPLIGLNFNFKELFGGSFSASVRYSTTDGYDISAGGGGIMEASTSELAGSASFSKAGFEIPLFGLYLKNDISISVAFSYSGSSRLTYQIEGTNLKTDGLLEDNTGRSSFEPRFQYTLSSKVTGSVYYRYSKTTGARITGTSTNEAGLEVHISIN